MQSCSKMISNKDAIWFYRTREEHGFLSNFWVGNPILVLGHVFRTSEHLYQALKVSHVKEEFETIRDAKTPKDAAVFGRASKNLREDWDEARVFAMRLALLLKFEDPEARTLLLDTAERELVEDTTTSGDLVWGRMSNGQGVNLLGKLLGESRAFYRALADTTAREEAADISQLQSEILSRLSTKKYPLVFP